MLGARIGTLVCYAFIAVAAVIFLCKITHYSKYGFCLPETIDRRGFCAFAAWGAVPWEFVLLPEYGKIITLAAIAIACVVYVIALLLLKAISEMMFNATKGTKLQKYLKNTTG